MARSHLLALGVAATLLAGCQGIDRKVIINQAILEPAAEETAGHQRLTASLKQADDLRLALAERRDEIDNTHTFLQAGFAAAIVGMGAAAIYDASKNLIVGLGTGAGVLYGTDALYFTAPGQIYADGTVAAACIVNLGLPIHSVGRQVSSAKTALLGYRRQIDDRVKWFTLQGSLTDTETSALNKAVEAVGRVVSMASDLDAFQLSEVDAAYGIERAVRELAQAVEIARRQARPTNDQIFAALGNVSSIGFRAAQTAFPNYPDAFKPHASVMGGKAPASSPERERELALLNQDVAAADALAASMRDQMTRALTALETVRKGTSCRLPAGTADPLVVAGVSGNAIKLKETDSQRFLVKGGTGNYGSQWTGREPDAKVRKSFDNAGGGWMLTLTTEKASAGDKHSLMIFDWGGGQKVAPVMLEIEVAK